MLKHGGLSSGVEGQRNVFVRGHGCTFDHAFLIEPSDGDDAVVKPARGGRRHG